MNYPATGFSALQDRGKIRIYRSLPSISAIPTTSSIPDEAQLWMGSVTVDGWDCTGVMES